MEDFKQRYIAARRAVIAQDLSRLNPMQRQAAMTTGGSGVLPGPAALRRGPGAFAGGVSPRSEDITVNICKKKQLTNMRASGSDEALRLVPPKQMSLEQCLEFLADDELLEVTPKSLRMRKAILDHEKRMKALHGKK